MMRVLVTGAAGFIGQHFVHWLSREGYTVRASVHRPNTRAMFPPDIEVVEGDVRDPSAMKAAAAGCEIIVHLAGKAHTVRPTRTEESTYWAVNVDGTRNVLEGAVSGGAQRFVFLSSVKVFGETTSGCVDESITPFPETPYSRSKLTAEELVSEYGARAGFTVTSLRLPLVYGPSDKGNLFRMIAAIDRGRFPPLPRVANVRSVVHILNLIQAVLLIVQCRGSLRPCYIVTDAQPYSVVMIYEWLCQGLGKPCPAWRVPLWVLRAAAQCGDVVEMLTQRSGSFSTTTLNKLIGSAWYSSEAIARDLGYCPIYSFAETVPQMIASYRQACR